MLFYTVTSVVFNNVRDAAKQTEKIQNNIDHRYNEFITWIENIESEIKPTGQTDKDHDLNSWDFEETYSKTQNNKYFSLFVYKNEQAIFWSNSLIISDVTTKQNGIIQLNNGWFFLRQTQIGDFRVLYLMQIKEVFPIANRFLKERFLFEQKTHDQINISTRAISDYAVYIADYPPFYLDFSKVEYWNSTSSNWKVFSFFILVASLLFIVFTYFLKVSAKKKALSAFLIILTFIFIRLIWLNNSFPEAVFKNSIFDPSIFAQSFLFPSLGDLILNSMFLLLFVSLISNSISSSTLILQDNRNKALALIFLFISTLWVFSINFLLEGLVKNSRIPFNIDHLFELDAYSLISMIGIAILFLSFILWLETSVRFIYKSGLSFSLFVLFLFTSFALYASIIAGLGSFDLTETFWSLPVIIALGTRIWFPQTRLGIGIGIFNLALISLFLAHVFEKYNIEKEHQIRQVIGERISVMQDPLQEMKLEKTFLEIQKSEWIDQLFQKDSISLNELSEIEIFFSSDWYKYDKSFSRINSNTLDFSKSEFNLNDTVSLLATFSEQLYFFHDNKGSVGYAFIFPIIEFSDTLGYLQGVFTELSRPLSAGFPQLMRSENNYIESYALDYTYARYFNGKRIFSNDEEFFPDEINEFTSDPTFEGYVNKGETSMLILPEEYGFRWIIGRPIPQILQKVTAFSYLFLFFGVLTFFVLFLKRLFQPDTLFYFSLRSKIQLIFISFIIAILTLYAIVIFDQITQQFHQRNKDQIIERLNSIYIELGHKLGDAKQLDEVPESRLNSYLLKFSEVFVADISLFDLNGQLSASSSSMIWDKKLLSRQMDPVAFENSSTSLQSRFIHEETLGNFAYLSGYRPLYNSLGEKIGYLNVPYFARQDELQREISRFLQVLINVFVLLLGLGVIIAIYVANWITSPLKMLQTNFASLDLINRNEPIKYSGNDEVASLVKAYNQKVSELENITGQIVQAEKESAWQEMARQVAHEIKNPLTPMRLSIQHYQRLLVSDIDTAIAKTPALMKALIEQIDNLNHIANEFSRFSQISVSSTSKFDLGLLMTEVCELYAHMEGVTLELKVEENCIINADRGQIMRMMNNLIQNAIQATKNEGERKVMLRLEKLPSHFHIEIEDNGSGINPELKEKIFKPNFTTKSKGMGLGLAIVHTIVNNHGATIYFKRAKNKGTIFIVDLPFS